MPPPIPLQVWRGPQVLFNSIDTASRFTSRLRGLLGRPPLNGEQGLLLSPCTGVHTIGMTWPIDVVFIDGEGVIIRCVPRLGPMRAASARGSRHVLELAAGSIARHELKPGQRLQWSAGVGPATG